MGTKREGSLVWMKVDAAERARLNLYKAMIGIADSNITDQSASLRALLNAQGVPSVPTGCQQPEAVPQ